MEQDQHNSQTGKSSPSAFQALVRQFCRYFVTGGLAFVVDFGLFALALYVLGIHYLVANLLGLVGGTTVNYILSFGWVFSSQKRRMEKHKVIETTIFVSIGLLGMLFNEGLMYVFVDMLNLQEMFAKIIAAAIVLIWNFAARKFILFQNGDKSVAKIENKDS